MSFKLLKKKIVRGGIARDKASAGAASKRARQFRRCGCRKPPEEAAGQAGVIVNDDAPRDHAD